MSEVPKFVGMKSLAEAFRTAREARVVLVRSVPRDFSRGWWDGMAISFQSVEAGIEVAYATVVKIGFASH